MNYTVAELNKLRELVRDKFLFGRYVPAANGVSRQYSEPTLTEQVEHEVRTHIACGHKPEDLIASEPQL